MSESSIKCIACGERGHSSEDCEVKDQSSLAPASGSAERTPISEEVELARALTGNVSLEPSSISENLLCKAIIRLCNAVEKLNKKVDEISHGESPIK